MTRFEMGAGQRLFFRRAFENLRRGSSSHNARHENFAAVGLHEVKASDFLRLIRAALDQAIRFDLLEQFERSVLLEQHHITRRRLDWLAWPHGRLAN